MDISPSVAIILPTFNRRKYLSSAIDSICNQTYANWNLFVINDGGENVSDIVESFNNKQIHYFDRPHEGKAATLNFGLSLVRAKYIAYMDDDDIVYPEHIANLIKTAEKNQADFVYSDTWAIVVSPEGKEIRRYVENDQDVTFDDIKFFNKINHKQILHSKKISDQVGLYDARMSILIDYDYIRRLAQQTTPIHLRQITGEHYLRQNTANESSSITGLWQSNPNLCGQSILALFDKDFKVLAEFYQYTYSLKNKNDCLKSENDCLKSENDCLKKILHATRVSFSYRLGRIFTAPLRTIISLFHTNV